MTKISDATKLPATRAMRAMIQRIATGPDLSKDLSEAEASYGMQLILNGHADAVQSGIFLIALRMKRETPAENRGILDAIRNATTRATAPVADLLDIADPYNGYNRTLTSSPFLPPVLAACGLPTYSHGVFTMGPKYGVTHAQVLAAAGARTDLDVAQAITQISYAGWAYVDQSRFCEPLHDLATLRTQIVKRPVVTTVEVLAGPIVGTERSHLMTGYVHKPYPPVYSMLARHAGFHSCVLVRGVEGGVVPSLRQPGRLVRYSGDGVDESVELDPSTLGITSDLRAAPFPPDLPTREPADGVGMNVETDAVAQACAQAGLAALDGALGPARDALVYAGAIALWHTHKADTLVAGADAIRQALDGGSARDAFRRGVGV
jgi:anthranilate phosphoribosyltransferase